MPLITEREAVLDIYARAAEKKWVIPTFCSENQTTTEAILSASQEYARQKGHKRLPVTLAITNLYHHRSQTVNYTHTKRWDMGMRLFLKTIEVLTGDHSPFPDVEVMIHLDHVQPESDGELLKWDMGQFSSIMFDASTQPIEQNMRATAEFMNEHGKEIVVEGACDEIVNATGEEVSELTTPERARTFIDKTGVDLIVANLGTEHRASAKDLQYHGDKARQIKEVIGEKIVLHGASSVPADQVRNLFDDGVCKVNIWTMLERDSTPVLFEDMLQNAARVAGKNTADRLHDEGLLGPSALRGVKAHLDYFTTLYRQSIIFEEMKRIARECFELWYL
ncbi:MAG: class II fructose-bisphosphate aldolase [Candidatus Sumerlaeia bacterium]